MTKSGGLSAAIRPLPRPNTVRGVPYLIPALPTSGWQQALWPSPRMADRTILLHYERFSLTMSCDAPDRLDSAADQGQPSENLATSGYTIIAGVQMIMVHYKRSVRTVALTGGGR